MEAATEQARTQRDQPRFMPAPPIRSDPCPTDAPIPGMPRVAQAFQRFFTFCRRYRHFRAESHEHAKDGPRRHANRADMDLIGDKNCNKGAGPQTFDEGGA